MSVIAADPKSVITVGVMHQLASCRTSLPFGQCQIVLLCDQRAQSCDMCMESML